MGQKLLEMYSILIDKFTVYLNLHSHICILARFIIWMGSSRVVIESLTEVESGMQDSSD
jgi:hypothetical protein